MNRLSTVALALALVGVTLAKTPVNAGGPTKNAKTPRTEKVVAEGVGATGDEALKDAFRNAVRQVVGAVVDTETLVKNDEIISDKVLTYSDGFIKSYDEISKKQSNGLFRIKIKANVERRSVIAKLKAESITVKDVDGQGLFAEAITQLEAEKNAKAFLQKALEGFPHNCLTMSVLGQPKLIEKNEKTATVEIAVRVTPNHASYNAFAKRLEFLLAKIATKKRQYAFQPLLLNGRQEVYGPAIVGPYERYFNHEKFAIQNGIPLYFLPAVDILFLHYGVKSGSDEDREGLYKKLGTFGVMLFHSAERNLQWMKWTIYDLDQSFHPLFQKKYKERLHLTVRLLDADQEELTQKQRSGMFLSSRSPHGNPEPGKLVGIGATEEKRKDVSVNINLVVPGMFHSDGRRISDRIEILPIGPFFYYSFWWGGAGGFSPEVRFVMPFEVSLDDLKNIKSIECKMSID